MRGNDAERGTRDDAGTAHADDDDDTDDDEPPDDDESHPDEVESLLLRLLVGLVVATHMVFSKESDCKLLRTER